MTRYKKEFLSVLTLVLSALPTVASAQVQVLMDCGDRNKGIAELKNRFAEEPVSMGLSSGGEVIEVFKSDTGTFSIIITRPDGVSCLLLSGENWEQLPVRPVGGAAL
ncbi:MAG: hypothetical protein A3G18_01310 [Rhodospirillales bacterium RIFCSPLOWO2_12_FULL_58_28]|nr:MAG: hypothetical protein A3H92_04510 [Rhodospirillales bacterium RIFCSPLOWO2_02_FULL_58_16]OHC78038.1 MAG: hypothetical protein A3G18_01310 [Rhodospirillales bacterium RIFCSPLOWO2_12_FULL_58_28]